MNFWEARQAALAGKVVRMVAPWARSLTPQMFLCDSSWRNEHLDAEWEVVEEVSDEYERLTGKEL